MFFSCPACHFQQRPLAHTQIALKLFDGVVVDVKKKCSQQWGGISEAVLSKPVCSFAFYMFLQFMCMVAQAVSLSIQRSITEIKCFSGNILPLMCLLILFFIPPY